MSVDTMEFDYNLVFGFVSMFAPILLISVTCITVFFKLKTRWPLKVNCWFCNEDTKIWRPNLDWWLCPSCKQYNGFAKNGDYAYDIPEQYATAKKCTRYCSLVESNNTNNILKDNLCVGCNKQENLKLRELANFECKNEKFYNTEIKVFKDYLEDRYPLCDNCKLTVQSVLNKQALWLTRYKMLFFRQKPVRLITNNAKTSATIFRIISTIFDSIIVYNHDFIWLPIGGLFFHLCACWTSPLKRNSDVLLIFLWFGIIILVSIRSLIILQTVWFATDYVLQYHMIMICACIIAFVNIKPNLYGNKLPGKIEFKKIKLHTQDTVASESIYNNPNKNNTHILNGTNNINDSTVYTTNESFSSKAESDSMITSQKLFLSVINNDNNSSMNSISLDKNNSSESYFCNDSLSTLSKLSLGQESPKYNERTSHIFKRKVYNTMSSDLFRKSSSILNRKCILSPPKLKSVMQTSWVAGGYWQEAINSPTLSRSSSQSSGFGSVGSNFASSREPSVYEFDRCSIMSDATQSCYTPRSNITSIMRSTHQYNSPVSHTPSQNILYDITTRNSSQFSSLPAQDYSTVAVKQHIQDYIKPSIDKKNPTSAIPNNTTIVANSTWLSALLCGSLILNIIVLCITLLH